MLIGGVSIYLWIGFIALVLVLLFLDLGIFNRKKHTPSVKEALIWTAVWFSLAMAFNVFIWFKFGGQSSLEFFTGYVLEKSLSVDNLFVILLIFTSFSIDPEHQHRVLFWGILGALVMRFLFIVLGAALVTRFEWILLLFGLFLLYTGIMMYFKKKDEEFDPKSNFAFKWVHKVVPISNDDGSGKFFTKENGRFAVTTLFVALLVVEFSDVIFAFDSIPAIFGVTLNPFIIFTSNVFAILGLRSLYFVLLRANNKFKYLDMALAVILIFIGLKMLIAPFVDISIVASLMIIVDVLVFYVLASLFILPRKKAGKEEA